MNHIYLREDKEGFLKTRKERKKIKYQPYIFNER